MVKKQAKLSDFEDFKRFSDWFDRIMLKYLMWRKKETENRRKAQKRAKTLSFGHNHGALSTKPKKEEKNMSNLENETRMELFLEYRERDGSKIEIWRPKIPKPLKREK